MNSISVQELHALHNQRPVTLVDVRTPEEFREVRVAFSSLVPMNTINPVTMMEEQNFPIDEPVYFICHVGGRSARTCLALMATGHPNVVNVEGGIEAWEAAGLPVERG
jgi:rhodanese-related sulfurtransferase